MASADGDGEKIGRRGGPDFWRKTGGKKVPSDWTVWVYEVLANSAGVFGLYSAERWARNM